MRDVIFKLVNVHGVPEHVAYAMVETGDFGVLDSNLSCRVRDVARDYLTPFSAAERHCMRQCEVCFLVATCLNAGAAWDGPLRQFYDEIPHWTDSAGAPWRERVMPHLQARFAGGVDPGPGELAEHIDRLRRELRLVPDPRDRPRAMDSSTEPRESPLSDSADRTARLSTSHR